MAIKLHPNSYEYFEGLQASDDRVINPLGNLGVNSFLEDRQDLLHMAELKKIPKSRSHSLPTDKQI